MSTIQNWVFAPSRTSDFYRKVRKYMVHILRNQSRLPSTVIFPFQRFKMVRHGPPRRPQTTGLSSNPPSHPTVCTTSGSREKMSLRTLPSGYIVDFAARDQPREYYHSLKWYSTWDSREKALKKEHFSLSIGAESATCSATEDLQHNRISTCKLDERQRPLHLFRRSHDASRLSRT